MVFLCALDAQIFFENVSSQPMITTLRDTLGLRFASMNLASQVARGGRGRLVRVVVAVACSTHNR